MSELAEKTYYVTSPIYYVNGRPHVGAALTTVVCDVLARWRRLLGERAWLLTGTDENASKVQEAAEAACVPTTEFVARLAGEFERTWHELHIMPDGFIRTSEPRHVHAVQEFFDRLRERDYVYLDTYEGWYSVGDETFYRDSEVSDGVAIESGKPVVRVKEENYFFRLSAFGDRLLAYIEENPGFLMPEFRRNEVMKFIAEGLRDMSITRANRGWGIPVRGDESKVIYVWFDALINYLSAIGWPDDPSWQALWPADAHIMGKEIFVRFHATLWPAMLMALDLPLPELVYGHGWWTIAGAKGGKTGPALPHPTDLSRLLAERSGAEPDIAVDAQRYILCREMNFGPDTEFSIESCLRRYNTDLANDLGNLLNRSINMTGRYYGGVVPKPAEPNHEFAALIMSVREEFAAALATVRLNVALESVWRVVSRLNKYIDEQAPWTYAKNAEAGNEASAETLRHIIYSCLEGIRCISVFLDPFMPFASRSIRAQLGITEETQPAANALQWGMLAAGTQTGPPVPLFPRIQELAADSEAPAAGPARGQAKTKAKEERPMNQAEPPRIGDLVPPPEAPPVAPTITIDEFMKVEMVVGEVLAAEAVPNATKLLRLTVAVSEDDTRTILAGIAESYQPEELVGRQVVVVANLQPRKMRGVESQGMLVAADVDGKAVLLQPSQPAPIGARCR